MSSDDKDEKHEGEPLDMISEEGSGGTSSRNSMDGSRVIIRRGSERPASSDITTPHDVRPLSADVSFITDNNKALGLGTEESNISNHSSSRPASASVRLPSTKGRSHLIRTPASTMAASRHSDLTSSDSEDDVIGEEDEESEEDDGGSVLITEVKGQLAQDETPRDWGRQGGYSDSSDEEEKHVEEDWDTDLEMDETIEEHDPTGRTQYQKTCEELGVVPVSYFSRHLTDSEMCMRNHGLGPAGTRAIAKVLKNNITLEKLNLSGNWMEGEGSYYMAKMLNENDYITDIILADNKFGPVGAIHMSKMLANHAGLRKIDLSGNDFTDHEAEQFADAIEQNKYLKELNLSRNKFGEEAGRILGPAIGANDVLERLDLSWNQIRRSGAVAVARGIKENIRLKTCDLSWNGFGSEGGAAIADAITANEALLELDISGNRLDLQTAVLLAKALAKHEELQVLRMGNNPITTAGCIAVAKALNESETSVLCELDLTDIPVEYEFKKLVQEIQKKRTLRVKHGPVLRSGTTSEDMTKRQVDPNPKNPLLVLRDHVIINDKRIVDILRQYDPQETYSVRTEEFASALKELGVPFNEEQLEQIASNLRRNEDGKIYYGDIVNQIEAAGGQAMTSPGLTDGQPVSHTAARLSAKKTSQNNSEQ